MLFFKKTKIQDVGFHPQPQPVYDCPLTTENVQALFADCDDFESRYVSVGGTAVEVFACWLDGTVSGSDIAEQILRPVTDPDRFGAVQSENDAAALLSNGLVYGVSMTPASEMDDVVGALSYGNCVLIFPGKAFLFQVKTDQHRSVEEPTVEKSVKGGKDAFVEPLRINTALVRSRLRTPKLKIKETVVGRKSRTKVAVFWIDGVASPELPRELLRRLDTLDVDGLIMPDDLDSGLSDSPRSPFPQLIHTERPDKLASVLLEGRVGVLADGIPVAFAAPAFFPDFMKTQSDSSQHFLAASVLRLLRWIALFLSLLLPAFYVAVAMYHAEMIPTELLLSVIQSKQSVPFSTASEVLGMLISFELLQEAGLRLPDPVGQTVSIIGALIVGQSAVDAKVISPIAVIVVALAGIAGYTMPSQDLGAAIRLIRFGLAIAAAMLGMYGVVIGFALLVWHLCSLESFGWAYMTPLTGPGFLPDGSFIRQPPWKDLYRNILINGGDLRRRK